MEGGRDKKERSKDCTEKLQDGADKDRQDGNVILKERGRQEEEENAGIEKKGKGKDNTEKLQGGRGKDRQDENVILKEGGRREEEAGTREEVDPLVVERTFLSSQHISIEKVKETRGHLLCIKLHHYAHL